MGFSFFAIIPLLVVVRDLDSVRVSVPPHKADAPLIVDPNAVLALAVSMQGFQPVASWNGQVAELRREMYLVQFPARDALNSPELPYRLPVKELLGIRVAEGPDHKTIV
jgi:hypothetical protein